MDSKPEPADDVFVRLQCAICGAWFGRLLSFGMAKWYRANEDVWLCALCHPGNGKPAAKHNYKRLKHRGKKT